MPQTDVKETDYNRGMSEPAGNDLSERELEILRLVATGVSNKEIAYKLSISPNTVKVHLRNIFNKIGVLSRTEAAMYAVRIGLLSDSISASASFPSTADLPISQQASEALLEKKPLAEVIKRRRLITWLVVILILAGLLIGGSVFYLIRGEIFRISANSPESPTSSASRWITLNPPFLARSKLAAVAFENRLYAIGGETRNGPTGLIEVYDPATNTWETRHSKPIPVADIQAAVIGGKIFIAGGRLSDQSVTNVLEIYDPRSDQWTKGAPLPVALSGYSLTELEGHLYLFGGWDGKEYRNSVYEYDPTQDLWRERSPMPTRRAWAGAAEAGGKIFVIGGFNGKEALSINEVYDPAREGTGVSPWETAEPLPVGRYGFNLVSISDVLVALGGETKSRGQVLPLRYFPSLRNWQELEKPYPTGWSFAGTAPLEAYIYIIGGLQNGKQLAQLQAYQALFTVILPIVR